MINTVVFMGRPGSGKDVQSKVLASKLNGKLFSSGDRFRAIAKEDSVLGRKVAGILDSGNLAPYLLASFFVGEIFLSIKGEEVIIFDGIGRQESEAKLFSEICDWFERDFRIINLNLSEQTGVERINNRHKTEGRSDDDNIQDRFKKYDAHTEPALEYFRSIGKVIDIDGEPLPEVVEKEIQEKLSQL